jgi:hypothetical protein
MGLFILVIIYFTNIEYYHMTLVRVFLTVEAQYFLSEKGQRIQRMSATCIYIRLLQAAYVTDQ